MMRVLVAFLVLGLLGGCAPQRASTQPVVLPPISAAEQAVRPERVVYSKKLIDHLKLGDEMTVAFKQALSKIIVDAAQKADPNNPDRLVTRFRQLIQPDIESRAPEVFDLMAGSLADIFTTDELRRMVELFTSPLGIKAQGKEPLTDQEMAQLYALGPRELANQLRSKRDLHTALFVQRFEVWAKGISDDVLSKYKGVF